MFLWKYVEHILSLHDQNEQEIVFLTFSIKVKLFKMFDF